MISLNQLLFPAQCACCSQSLQQDEQTICLHCSLKLPRTYFHQSSDNPALHRFLGRADVEQCACFCYFEQGSLFRQAIHHFKYHQQAKIAQALGRLFAQELHSANWHEGIDAIVPVPIHWYKKTQRGYNQTEFIARGIQQSWQIPIALNLIQKKHHTTSQTHKNLFDRWVGIEQTYLPRKNANHPYNHLLLVDDVLTSGSTLIACHKALTAIKPTKISILTLGFAE